MRRSAGDLQHQAIYPTSAFRVGAVRRVVPRIPAATWQTVRGGATRCLLALLVLSLAGLGSYSLEASKARPPNLAVERICPRRFSLTKDQVAVQVPVCLNVESLETPNPAFRTAVIVVHGSSRNAAASESSIEAAVQATGRHDVLVVAPQFLNALDVQGQDSPPDVAIWRHAGWNQGDRSDGTAQTGRPSSFEVLDRLVEEISRRGRYPNLAEIVIAGHSAGGQLVQRYAAGTRIEQQATVVARHLTLRYVAANPSSYAYLFPRQQDALTERCPRYDVYKFGLTDPNAYLRPLGPDGIRAAYRQKDVTILLGQLDFQMLDPSKDDSCEAVLQGANRVNRGIRYVQQLDQSYGIGNHRTQRVMVPGVGHNARGMFTSPEGRALLFGQ